MKGSFVKLHRYPTRPLLPNTFPIPVIPKLPTLNPIATQSTQKLPTKGSNEPGPSAVSPPQQAPQQQTPSSNSDRTLFQIIEAESKGAYEFNVDTDLEPVEMVAEGGAAQIFTAKVLNPALRVRMGPDANELVVVKLLKGLFSLIFFRTILSFNYFLFRFMPEPGHITKERVRATFQQEVAIMWLLGHHKSFIKVS